MRYLLLSTPILALAALAPVAHAQAPQAAPPAQAVPQPTAPAAESAAPTTAAAKPLDTLFEVLKRERDPEKAKGIASQVIAEMNDSGSATVNLLMQWSEDAIKEKKNAAALDFLDRVTLLDPAFTEGWNRRATLHYTMGDQRKAMADIAEVLKREPRHFGALAGLAGILTEAGDDDMALKAWERYLNVYPADREAQEAVSKLSEKIAGNRT
ncbi:Tetratricopeptide repeat protein [compost metagenome]